MTHHVSSLTRRLERWGVPLALGIGAAMLFAGLGSDGLWEPWEMDRAQVARDLAGPGQVAAGLDRHETDAVRASLETAAEQAGTVLRLSTLPTRKVRTHANATKTVRGTLDRARNEVVAAVVLDLGLAPKGDGLDYDRAWRHLQEALGHVPIGRVIALVPGGDEAMDQTQRGLEGARLRAGAAAAVAPFGLELSPWPEGEETAPEDGPRTLPERLVLAAGTDTERLTELLVEAREESANVARFKLRGSTLMVPPLRHRISAVLTSTLGTTEATVRLAGGLLAFLALLAVVLSIGGRFGGGLGFITGLVLATTPLFFLHGRSVVGEPGALLALSLVAIGLLEASWAASPRRVWSFLLSGLAIGFLAKGLTLVFALFALVAAVSAIAGDRRLGSWLPAIVFGLFFAGAAAWVLSSPPDSFAGQFRFTQKLFSAGPTAYDRNFDWAIKRLGFGTLPWSPFLVLAMADQVRRAVRESDRGALIIVLWFTVPTLIALGMLKDFNIAIWWGAPAMAVAVGAWIRDLWHRGKPSRFEGFLLVVMALILLRELGKSPAPLVDIVAFDPPLADKAGQRFPDEVKLASWIRLATLGLIGLVFVHQARLVEIASRVCALLARPRPAAWATALALILVPITWLVRVGSKYTEAMGHADMKALSPEQRAFPLRFIFRSGDPVMVLSIAAVSLVVGVALWRVIRLKWRPWSVDEVPIAAGGRRVLFARMAAGSAIALGVHMLLSVSWPDGYWAETLLHPALLAVVAGAGLAALAARRLDLPTLDGPLLALGWLGLWLGTRLSRDAELVTWGAAALTAGIALGLGGLVLPRLQSSVRDWARVGSWLVFGALMAIFAPLVDRWETVEAFLYPDVSIGTLEYLLTRSRLTWGLVGLIVFLVLNRRMKRPDDRDTVRALFSLVEHRRVAAISAALAGLVFSVGMLTSFQPAVAFHVSQKHIMDTYRASEGLGLGELGPRIFRHGTFASTGRANTNFYTAGIPEVRDKNAALKALLASRDQVLAIETTDGSSSTVVPGWDAANDRDGDGARDHRVLRGTASRVVAGRLTDETAAWSADAHKGSVLVDSRGKTWKISGNTETELTLSGTGIPTFSATRPERNFYTIDADGSKVHGATSEARHRTYMLLPAETFSGINHSYRKISDGEHVPIVDGRSTRVLLAASWLEDGEVQQNRFALHTMSKSDFDALRDPRVHRASTNFDDTIRVLGYRTESETVSRGKKIRLTFYFEALKDMKKSYKIFLHIDQSGNRIHGDHWPLNLKKGEAGKKCVGCFKTEHWLKGDVVMDVFETEVPAATPSGAHEIWLGFFTPGSDKRLKVKDWDKKTVRHDGHNRVRLGKLQVR